MFGHDVEARDDGWPADGDGGEESWNQRSAMKDALRILVAVPAAINPAIALHRELAAADAKVEGLLLMRDRIESAISAGEKEMKACGLEALTEESKPERMSCAQLIAAGRQSLAVNQRIAAEATDYLVRMLIGPPLTRFATYIDLPTGSTRSCAIMERVPS